MPRTKAQAPHVLILFSDTGGGHRSAAEAIVEAIGLRYGDRITTEMVDFLKEYAPPPFNLAPDLYPEMVKSPRLWEFGFYATDGRLQALALTSAFWPYVSRNARALVRNHPADVVVTVHPLATSLVLQALGKRRPPFITVVTDIVTTHAFWFDQRADLILVPSEEARERALANDIHPARVRVTGFPVMKRYTAPPGDKVALRRKLGWPEDQFIALLVGGGEGMGPLAETAQAIADSGLDVGLCIVTGRNIRLRAELEGRRWPRWTQIHGFTRQMPDLMRAADALVSKAGTGTVCEALNAGLPIILYARLPGQEDGNALYVVRSRAGVWAPTPARVVHVLRRWLEHPEERTRIAENCRRVARPEAADVIARIIAEWLGVE